jgi:UDP-glucose 4-epimerase
VKVLVCGGAGFIGSHLVERLVADGHEVLVVDDLSHGKLDNLAGVEVEFERLDITDPGLAELVGRVRPEVVYNLAAQIDVRISVNAPVLDAATNILGTLAILEAARRSGTRKVVLASSVAVYGPPARIPVTEQTPTNPLSPYAVSKLAGEFYLRQYQQLHGLDTTTLTLTNTYGPRQDPHGEAGVVAIFANAMLAGAPTRVFGDGSNSRDYVYVGDVVEAFVLAGGRASQKTTVASGRRLNIGTGVATTDLHLHRTVAAAVGGAPEPEYAPQRLGDLPHMAVDASMARQVLGWVPRTPLGEGIARTVAAMRSAALADR